MHILYVDINNFGSFLFFVHGYRVSNICILNKQFASVHILFIDWIVIGTITLSQIGL